MPLADTISQVGARSSEAAQAIGLLGDQMGGVASKATGLIGAMRSVLDVFESKTLFQYEAALFNVQVQTGKTSKTMLELSKSYKAIADRGRYSRLELLNLTKELSSNMWMLGKTNKGWTNFLSLMERRLPLGMQNATKALASLSEEYWSLGRALEAGKPDYDPFLELDIVINKGINTMLMYRAATRGVSKDLIQTTLKQKEANVMMAEAAIKFAESNRKMIEFSIGLQKLGAQFFTFFKYVKMTAMALGGLALLRTGGRMLGIGGAGAGIGRAAVGGMAAAPVAGGIAAAGKFVWMAPAKALADSMRALLSPIKLLKSVSSGLLGVLGKLLNPFNLLFLATGGLVKIVGGIGAGLLGVITSVGKLVFGFGKVLGAGLLIAVAFKAIPPLMKKLKPTIKALIPIFKQLMDAGVKVINFFVKPIVEAVNVLLVPAFKFLSKAIYKTQEGLIHLRLALAKLGIGKYGEKEAVAAYSELAKARTESKAREKIKKVEDSLSAFLGDLSKRFSELKDIKSLRELKKKLDIAAKNVMKSAGLDIYKELPPERIAKIAARSPGVAELRKLPQKTRERIEKAYAERLEDLRIKTEEGAARKAKIAKPVGEDPEIKRQNILYKKILKLKKATIIHPEVLMAKVMQDRYKLEIDMASKLGSHWKITTGLITKSAAEQMKITIRHKDYIEGLKKIVDDMIKSGKKGAGVDRLKATIAKEELEYRKQLYSLQLTNIEAFEKEMEGRKKFIGYDEQRLAALQEIAKATYQPPGVAINLQMKMIKNEEMLLAITRKKLEYYKQLEASGRGDKDTRMKIAELTTVEVQKLAAIAKKADYIRRTWMEQYSEMMLGATTGTYLVPGAGVLSGLQERGAAFRPFGPTRPQRGMGTYQQMYKPFGNVLEQSRTWLERSVSDSSKTIVNSFRRMSNEITETTAKHAAAYRKALLGQGKP